MRFYLLILVCILPLCVTRGQDIIGVGTRWNDSFREWDVHTTQESRTGSLQLRWKLDDDWSQWTFRLGDTTAQIRLKWKDDPNLWEIRCLGETVTARTIWSNDFRQWRITDGTHSIHWQSRYGNVRDEWIIRGDDSGTFTVYTYWEGDPREWVVMDELKEDTPYAMRLAMIFIAIFNSIPKV